MTFEQPICGQVLDGQVRGDSELNLKFAIKSVQPEVSRVVMQFRDWLQEKAVPLDVLIEQELVLAEALNNVVEHAYLFDDKGEIEIYVKLTVQQLETRISDSGCAFEGPVKPKEIDPQDYVLADLPEGGFGWPLIQTLSDEFYIWREKDRNHLTLIRFLTEADASKT